MAISPQQLKIYLTSAYRAVIFAIAQLSCFLAYYFLATRTNGRAYATVLLLSVTLCIVAKWCILEQNLKSIGTKMNDLDL